MKDIAVNLAVLLLPLLLAALLLPAPVQASDSDWPQFRGNDARGVAEGYALPDSWNLKKGENILWRTPIPGLGLSSPVVWGDHLFVTTSVAESGDVELKVGRYGDIGAADDQGVQTWKLYCLDKNSGEIVWQTVLHQGPPATKRHTKASHANSTPAVDGEHIAVMLGSEGLHVLDMQGELKWKKEFGVLQSSFFMMPQAEWGYASSPAIHDGKLVVQADVIKDSFLVLYDLATGAEIWRIERNDFPTWSSPTVHTFGETTQILVNGFKHMGGYDFADGSEIWKMAGGGDIPIPTPFVAHDLVFLTNSHGSLSPVYAVRAATAKGDISLEKEATSNEHITWSVPRKGAYMPTPLVYGDKLFVLRDSGILLVYEAATGKELHEGRVAPGVSFTASGVAGDGKIYYSSEMGEVFVVDAETYKTKTRNDLDETILATPAISAGTLFVRTRGHVVAIASKDDSADGSSEEGGSAGGEAAAEENAAESDLP